MKLYDVYPLFDVEIVSGNGCTVKDKDGNEYIDAYGGHAVISIGHSHPRYVKAVADQVARLGFYSNSVINPLQQQLADRIGRLSGLDDYRLFLVNSGAEANENALKLASFHTGRRRVIAISKAFHGRTSAAVEATDNPRIVAPINNNGNVTFVPMNDIEAIKAEIARGDVAAVIIEGIQGVGGVIVPDDDFMRQLRRVTADSGVVMIVDEIQSGTGRTGRFFAHSHAGIKPDIITMAKGIGNGFPIGAMLIGPQFEATYGQLGTTFGGNHLACAASIAVMDVIADEKLVENAAAVGDQLLKEATRLPGVKEVRGRGLMIGIEMEFPVKELRRDLVMTERLFTGASGTNVIRLLPPLSFTRDLADETLKRLERAINRHINK